MGRSHSKVFSIAIGFCAALADVGGAVAQQQAPQKPRPQAPIKAYQPVATTLPTTVNDPTFDAFRRQLGEIAVKKDKAGLARIVVAQGFFWKGEKGEKADKNKSGMDNLAAAVQLNAKDDSGWDQLASYAYDPTAAPIASHQGRDLLAGGSGFQRQGIRRTAQGDPDRPGGMGLSAAFWYRGTLNAGFECSGDRDARAAFHPRAGRRERRRTPGPTNCRRCRS